MRRFVNPVSGDTIDRKAGCGKTARPVWREGRSNPIDRSYPYPLVCDIGPKIKVDAR
jgi:hypothetical protein